MPIYEYECSKCGISFEKLVFGQEEVSCPECGCEVKKLMSACCFKSAAGDFKTSGTGGSSCTGCTSTSCASCH